MPASAFKQDAQAFHIYGEVAAWAVDVRLRWANQCIGNDLTLRADVEWTPEGIEVQVMGLELT